MIDYRVYLITDDPSRYVGNWLENVEAAIEGGVTVVQYRDTESPSGIRFERAKKLHDMLIARHIPLVINNEPELARALSAEGVHVGQHDLPPCKVREIVGDNCEIGYSITCREDLKNLNTYASFVDCIGIGPIFDARKTKADASNAIGIVGLGEIVRAVPEMPNCAIGGITLENGDKVIAAGAKGLAVVSAFSKSNDPLTAARRFAALFK